MIVCDCEIINAGEFTEGEWSIDFCRKHTSTADVFQTLLDALKAPTHQPNDSNCEDWPPGSGCDGCQGDALRTQALVSYEERLVTEFRSEQER